MSRIIILENTVTLRVKIEKILSQYEFYESEFIKNTEMVMSNVDYILKNADLIIMDYDNYMEKSTEIIVKFREKSKEKKIPIIVITSTMDVPFLKKAAILGSVDVLAKPFDDIKLLESVFKFDAVNNRKKPLKQENCILKWKDEFKIGIEEIDKDHESIIMEFGKLYNLMKNGEGHEYYKELLNFLDNYVNIHFRKEESIQEKFLYDDMDKHKKMHIQFENHVKNIMKNNSNREATNEDLIKINLFVKNWLIHHIFIEDKKIVNFINKKN